MKVFTLNHKGMWTFAEANIIEIQVDLEKHISELI